MSRPRVILVREWDSQHTGSGCCGTLGGDDAEVGAGDWAHSRTLMEGVGAVYRALRAEYGDAIDLEVVDPRNTAWLLPATWRDARQEGASRAEAWRSVRDGTANGAVVCGGQVVGSATADPAEVVDQVAARLAAMARRHAA